MDFLFARTSRFSWLCALFTWFALLSMPTFAALQRVEAVQLELVAGPRSQSGVAPATVWVGLRIRHDPHWHTYWRNPGDSGLATQIQWELPAGWKAGEIAWPVPERIAVGPLANYGYEGELLLPVLITPPPGAMTGPDKHKLAAKVAWLMCKDVCIPGEARLELELSDRTVSSADLASLFKSTFEKVPALKADGVAHTAQWITPAPEQAILVFAKPLQQALASVSVLEFFPFVETLVKPPAPQKLIRLPNGDLALHLALYAEPPPTGVPTSLDGVLKTAAGNFELRAPASTMAAPAGGWSSLLEKPVGIATVTPEAPKGLSSGTRLLSAPSASPESAIPPAPAANPISLGLAMVFAVLGGMLLNLMPCVFPVLSLKVLSLAGDATKPAQARRNGIWFSLGVLVCFVGLAMMLLALRSAGESIGWGFQLQSPWVVSLLCLLFVALGLNFFGVFEIGGRVMQVAGSLDQRASSSASSTSAFFSGLLAALVATPCTAPFMGGAIGFTLDQPAGLTLLVFGLVGLGMALPFLVLSFAPRLLARLPRPGVWMETLKHVLAFPMFLTAVWLAWVLGALTSNDALGWLGVAVVLLSFVLWQWGRLQAARVKRASVPWLLTVISLIVSLLLLAYLVPVKIVAESAVAASTNEGAKSGAVPQWEKYDAAQAEQLLRNGKTVFVDFTAAWCISCQANKKLVLDTEAGRALLVSSGAALMRADWTRRDPAITAALARYGRNGVPVYLVLSPERNAQLLPELLTHDILRRALEKSR